MAACLSAVRWHLLISHVSDVFFSDIIVLEEGKVLKGLLGRSVFRCFGTVLNSFGYIEYVSGLKASQDLSDVSIFKLGVHYLYYRNLKHPESEA